jgi:hypothetical protein
VDTKHKIWFPQEPHIFGPGFKSGHENKFFFFFFFFFFGVQAKGCSFSTDPSATY